jgi:hypothetical protein
MLGGHQTFVGLEMLENAWWALSVFWIKNATKCLVVTKHFLDQKS